MFIQLSTRVVLICTSKNLWGPHIVRILHSPQSLGLFTLMQKKNLTKFWHTCQKFGRFSYIVTKIWQQTKCSHFFGNFTKIW